MGRPDTERLETLGPEVVVGHAQVDGPLPAESLADLLDARRTSRLPFHDRAVEPAALGVAFAHLQRLRASLRASRRELLNLGVCVYREGDVPCPGGGYDRRMLRYRAVVDGRHCAKCTCGSLNSPCRPRVDFTVDQPTCDEGTTLEAIGDCRPLTVPASAQSLNYHFVGDPAPGDTCDASEPKALGEMTESEPVTVCCEPSPND